MQACNTCTHLPDTPTHTHDQSCLFLTSCTLSNWVIRSTLWQRKRLMSWPMPHTALCFCRLHRPCMCIDLVVAGWRPILLPQILHHRQRLDSTTVHLRLLPCIHLWSLHTLMLGLGPVFISVHHCTKIRMSDEMADPSLHTLMFCQAAFCSSRPCCGSYERRGRDFGWNWGWDQDHLSLAQ